ncbi:MAG TPA: MBL fold metallo-hydrolase [Dehalococcoidia bacterium]|nr:MBL fold metallo-hydrolase [Dehalococcoidia bacterium]
MATNETMILEGFPTGMFQENCFIAGCAETKEALIVDPGDDAEQILAALERNDLTAKLIVVTHEHIDHIGAVEAVREATKAPVAMHAIAYDGTAAQSQTALMLTGRPQPRMGPPEVFLVEGQDVQVGKLKFQVLFCPGHTPGHICLYGEGVLFSGDVLFQLSIGRFDLPGGDGPQLLRSIRDKLWPLPDDTLVLPGHGPATSIGQEKEHNPFIKYPRVYMGFDVD